MLRRWSAARNAPLLARWVAPAQRVTVTNDPFTRRAVTGFVQRNAISQVTSRYSGAGAVHAVGDSDHVTSYGNANCSLNIPRPSFPTRKRGL